MALVTYAFENEIEKGFKEALNSVDSTNINYLISDQPSAETPAKYIYIEATIGSPISDERTNADGEYDHYEADLSFEVSTGRLDDTTPPNDPSSASSTVSNFHDYMLTIVRSTLDGSATAVVNAFDDEPVKVVKIMPAGTERSKDEDDRVTVLNYSIQFIVLAD